MNLEQKPPPASTGKAFVSKGVGRGKGQAAASPGWCSSHSSSVQFNSVVSDSLRPHESQHARPPCPSQTHAHQVGDAIQPSHPLSSPSPPVPNPSQLQGLFQQVNSRYEVVKVLEFQLQHQSFQWTPRTYLLQNGLLGSPCSPRDSQESSPTPQFKSIHFHHSSRSTIISPSGPVDIVLMQQ